MRNKFSLAFVLCTLAWGSVIGIIPDQSSLRALPNSSPASAENKCEINKAAALITHDVLSSWQSYRDADFDFVLEYPVGWQVQEVIFQSEPYLDPKAILKRLTFIGAEGMIDLDIWLSHNRDLGEWLKWYGRTRNEIPVIHPNAMIGNQPAVMYLQKGGVVDVLTTFFAEGSYIYRFWYTVMHNEAGLQAYLHAINSFTHANYQAAEVQLPDSVMEEARLAEQESSVISPLISNCCGYYSSGNPFPCCDDKGNCTWWVWYRYSTYVPFRGDAWTWWGQVPDYYGWWRSTVPHMGENIAWWDKSSSNNYLGHVAHVSNYTGGDNISLTEMAWCTICYRSRTISRTIPNGYLFVVKEPPPQ